MIASQYKPAFYVSIAFHIVVLLLLIVSFEFSSKMPVLENTDKNMRIISAVVMDAPAPPLPEPAPTPPVAVAQPKPPEPQPAPADPQQIQKQREIEIKKEEAIALKAQRKKELAQKKALEKQLLADIQKQAANDKKAKQRALEQAMEKEMKEHTAKALQQQLLSEQKRVVGAKMQGEVNKYKALILQAISRRWLVPPGVNKELTSVLLITLAPGGTVLDVQITKSSGDLALDRSARDAVFKASPLPVPEESDAFDQLRQIVLKVKPKDILSV